MLDRPAKLGPGDDLTLVVGLGDLSYFTRSFRRRFEMTPSEARELARRENNTTL